METATKMMKNGATPDVLTFINETIWEIENVILQAIVDDHRRDQELIVASRNRFDAAVADMRACSAQVEEDAAALQGMIQGHKECRAGEALACARSRKCEEELEELWLRVVTVETEMRRIHWSIHGEWCVPPLPPHPGLADPWNWPDEDHWEGPETSQSVHEYPHVNQGDDVIRFRTFTVDAFGEYIIQLPIVEETWELYNRKLLECAALEETWQLHVDDCDVLQTDMNEAACEHHAGNRQCASNWGHEYEMATDEYSMLIGNGMYVDGQNDMHLDLYNYLVGRGITVQRNPWGTTQCDVPGNPPLPECTALPLLEFERKREWESLSIVLCLLRTVYTHVIHSIDSGEPCPTTESHPEETVAEINYCHTIDFAAAGTANLTLEWFEPPPPPDLPPVIPEPCTLEFQWETTGFFGATLQTTYEGNLRIEDLETYNTVLSVYGWPGCAPAKACIPCETTELVIDPNYVGNTQCKEHHGHLNAGEMNRDTFKCLSGDQCVSASGRCNEVNNCDDGSDELGCDTVWGTPAILHQEECKSPFYDSLQFRCADNVHCTHIFGKCNGINNCADGSDEVGCATTTHGVVEEATSGYSVDILTPELHTHVFQDREYTIDSLGSFAGHTFIQMSNEDKHTSNGKIQMKLRLPRPTVIYVVKLDSTDLPWLDLEGWSHTQLEGIAYHGSRRTRHTDWSQELSDDHYEAGQVWQKTFSAGTVWMRGNHGGDGSYVMFMANPGNVPQPPHCPNCLPGHDTYLGCYTDNSARDLGPMVGVWQNAATNTYELCRAECLSRGNIYMSLQWGGECFCANEYATAPEYYMVDDSNCNVVREPCSPNSHNCGGTWHQAIYQIAEPQPEYDSQLTAYWERGNCGVHGNDWNWGWCNNQAGTCPHTVMTDYCASGAAELAEYRGDGSEASYVDANGCQYWWHAQYVCLEPRLMVDGCLNQNTEVDSATTYAGSDATASVRCCTMSGDSCDSDHLPGGCQSGKTYTEAVSICEANGERLCTHEEILDRLCCGSGCQFDGHQIWVAH